eukprot:TRINITY_DN36877_c0_g1_i1.p1 TRINITY_DN36877_c0_g1~~TRINITY_DN36877_c0_g1_i1.p1  ORF type:complete len:266 (+),score=68.35 TRINITY_DN36877_c0_g1_i1:23-799(+)
MELMQQVQSCPTWCQQKNPQERQQQSSPNSLSAAARWLDADFMMQAGQTPVSTRARLEQDRGISTVDYTLVDSKATENCIFPQTYDRTFERLDADGVSAQPQYPNYEQQFSCDQRRANVKLQHSYLQQFGYEKQPSYAQMLDLKQELGYEQEPGYQQPSFAQHCRGLDRTEQPHRDDQQLRQLQKLRQLQQLNQLKQQITQLESQLLVDGHRQPPMDMAGQTSAEIRTSWTGREQFAQPTCTVEDARQLQRHESLATV